MVTTLQPFQLGNLHMAKGSGNTPLAVDVSLPSRDFLNGAHYRMPWAVSRDLQPAAITGKELYFRVTDPLLKDVAHGGAVKTGFDFELTTFAGAKVPYVIKSYDGAGGTLMGVLNGDLAGSAAATRGYLYFSNPGWTVSREDSDQTFPNAVSVLFLPSRIDRSGSKLDFDADLPTSDKVIVNPGALVDGSMVPGNDIERALTGNCGSFLISVLCQSIPNNVDNSPLTFGSGTGSTVIYMRHCFATPNGPHPDTDITNCWRVGFATGGKETDYETAQGTADQTLQHIVFRRVLGSRPELYINGVISPFSFSFEDVGTPAILSSRLDFTNQKIIVGRGSVTNTRWWNGYIDCFKFFKDDAKSATWALAEYSNLMDIDGGVIFGSPETVTTASVWGETIKIQTDQLTSVDFKADKYSATVGGTIALRSPNPFDPPDFGRFSDQGANTVRYTNTNATDPDNAGAVHLTNGVGNVIIPVRAHIITSAPPPPSGFYGYPNDYSGKHARTVANRNDFINALTESRAANWTRDNYIKLTGDVTGSAVTVNGGGTAAHPLVITADGAGTDAGWNTRPKIQTVMITTSPYTWFYGVHLYYPAKDTAADAYANTFLTLKADWQFTTACKLTGPNMIRMDAGDVEVANIHINFNFGSMWFSKFRGSNGKGLQSNFITSEHNNQPLKMSHPLTIAYNYFIDDPNTHVYDIDNKDDNQVIYFGEGTEKAQAAGYYSDILIEKNFVKGAISRGFYLKFACNVYRNDVGPVTTPGGSTYGGADCVIGFRGCTPVNGKIYYNRLRGGQQLMCHSYNHEIVGNILGSATRIHASAHLEAAGKPTLSADGCKFIGNTGALYLPWYVGNADKPTANLGAFTADAGRGVLIAGHNGSIIEQASGGGDGPAIPFSGGHPSGSHPWLTNGSITKQDAIPAGYTIETPPSLSTTTTGPSLATTTGKQWGT
jgi:hypothetical protein